jgi:hypothetical protein
MSHSDPDEPETRDDNRIAVIFGLLFLAGGLVFTVGTWGAYLRDTTILDSGVRVQAEVVSLERIHDTGPDGSTDHLVKYRYTAPDGRTIVKQAGLGRTQWSTLRVGGPVDVAYDPGDAAKALPVGGGVTSPALLAISSVFGLVMGGGGLALLLAVARRRWLRPRQPA